MIKFQNDPGGFDMVRNSWRVQLDTNEGLWHRGDFRAGASSLRFPLIALHLLHDTTTECHAGARHPGASHPGCCTGARISLQYEISQRYHVTRNDHTFRCEIGLPVDWNGKRMRNVCDFESRVYFYQHEVYLQITRYEMTQSSCKRNPKSKSHPGMKLTPVRVFSYKHPLISFLGCIQRKAPNFRINNRLKFNNAKYHFFFFCASVYASSELNKSFM